MIRLLKILLLTLLVIVAPPLAILCIAADLVWWACRSLMTYSFWPQRQSSYPLYTSPFVISQNCYGAYQSLWDRSWLWNTNHHNHRNYSYNGNLQMNSTAIAARPNYSGSMTSRPGALSTTLHHTTGPASMNMGTSVASRPATTGFASMPVDANRTFSNSVYTTPGNITSSVASRPTTTTTFPSMSVNTNRGFQNSVYPTSGNMGNSFRSRHTAGVTTYPNSHPVNTFATSVASRPGMGNHFRR